MDTRVQQRWDAERYARHARFVADLATPVVELLAPTPHERILDLGCGDGALTEVLAATGTRVVGIDASPEMAAAARARGLDVWRMDAAALPFEAEFDAVFSNAALHWMPNLDAVVDKVWRALRPGGRFVGEMGGEGNIASITTAIDDALARRGLSGKVAYPWAFPAPAEWRCRLERCGFSISVLGLLPRPTPLPNGLEEWLQTFAESVLTPLPEPERPGFIAEVCEALAPDLRDADGRWVVDYVRLRFAATKPA